VRHPPHPYRGRLAPSPTGLLHVGHARTFWIAAQRAAERQGRLILRNEDLDPHRSRAEFAAAMVEDLHWLGIRWSEGPDSAARTPYVQSERRHFYLDVWRRLRDMGAIYPARVHGKICAVAGAPNENDADDEPFIQVAAGDAPMPRRSPNLRA